MLDSITIYIAGRIERSRERFGVIECALPDHEWKRPLNKPPITGFYHQGRRFNYSGPYTVGCDHGCAHRARGLVSAETVLIRRESGGGIGCGTGTHGSRPTCSGDYGIGTAADSIHRRSFAGIAQCDYFFAWIEDEQCFGTLVEIGHAAALNKPIAIASPLTIPDAGELWFALQCAQTRIYSKSPNEAARAWLDWLIEYEGIPPEEVAA